MGTALRQIEINLNSLMRREEYLISKREKGLDVGLELECLRASISNNHAVRDGLWSDAVTLQRLGLI